MLTPILWPPGMKNSHWKKPWCWERVKAGGEGDGRGWDSWIVSPTQWTRVWASSGSWWWTGKPGVLQSMGSQSIGHDWVTELNLSFPYHIFCVLCHRLIDHVSMGLFLGSLFFSLDFCFCFCGIPYCLGASLVAQRVKRLLAMRKTWIWSLSWEDPLEEGMATHSSILAWRIPMDRGAWWASP